MATISKKVLFIDTPFAIEEGIRAKRSRFLWDIVSRNFDADLLLLKSDIYREKPISSHSGYDKLYSLSLKSENKLEPIIYHHLGKGQAGRFAHILDSKRYEIIFFGGLACLPLLKIANRVLPNCEMIIDVEKVYISDLKEKWESNRELNNISYLWEYIQQYIWDKYLINKKPNCLYANPGDLDLLCNFYKINKSNSHFVPLPITDLRFSESTEKDKRYIIFWGSPENKDNLTVAKNIVSEIYPRISKKLVEKNIGIILCGEEKMQEFCSGRISYAPYDDLDNILEQALFIILPLEKPDTEGRILSCAAHHKALVCTKIAIQNFPVEENCYLQGDCFTEVSDKILELLRGINKLNEYSDNFFNACWSNFQAAEIERNLLERINTWIKKDVTTQ
mgnify:FL=1